MDQGRDDIREVVKVVIDEFLRAQKDSAEPEYRTELVEERKKREGLEQRVNELIVENGRAKSESAIRAELQRLGVVKIDLAYRAVKDDLAERDGTEMREYLARFATENPELLPARLAGGSGASNGQKVAPSGGVDLDKIRPGMSPEE